MVKPGMQLSFPFLLLLLISPVRTTVGLQLVTTATVRGVSPDGLHRFLATPTNWPEIVASSQSVRPAPTTSSSAGAPPNRVDVPLGVGERVEEVFGLPPIVPLSVFWTCERSDVAGGVLDFYSADGLRGVAKDCRMKFRIEGASETRGRRLGLASEYSDSTVTLTMEYEPLSPLAVLATPVLTLDNALALKVLLPSAV